mmetsp:Transcript_16832/g.28760  ORF Transcript_16832/g.28760 Transcript_16832/m.28760 type:complete len:251 (+) Transcript_16832:379-1131(+)
MSIQLGLREQVSYQSNPRLQGGRSNLHRLSEAPQSRLVDGLSPIGGTQKEDALLTRTKSIHPRQQCIGRRAMVLGHTSSIPAAEKGIYLIQKDHRRRRFAHHFLQGLDPSLRLPVELGHHVARANVEEAGVRLQLHGRGARQHGLAAARRTVQEQSLGSTSNAREQSGTCHGWPQDGLSNGFLGPVQADDIFEPGFPSQLRHLHARGAELGLQFGQVFLLFFRRLTGVVRRIGHTHFPGSFGPDFSKMRL